MVPVSETYVYAESLHRILSGIVVLIIGTVFASIATKSVETELWMSAFFGWVFTFIAVGGGMYLLWSGMEMYDRIEREGDTGG